MLKDKDQLFFKGLLLKELSEAINSNNVLESIKVDDHEKLPDLLDQAIWTHNSNISLLLLEKNNMKMDSFKNALERINEGTYGICEGCSERISKERLKAIPFTRFCISCQRENEIRPVEALC